MRRQAGAPLFLFLQGKVGYWIAPSSDPASPAHLPPEGKALGVGAQRVENFLSQKCFPAYFFRKNASQIGLSIPKVTAPLSYQRQRSPKRANGRERAMNPGVQGRSPGPLSPHFSGEMGTPAGQAGQRGAAPQSWEQPRPPKGYAVPSPAVVGRKPHVAGLCRQTSKSPPANLGRGAKDLSGPLPWR